MEDKTLYDHYLFGFDIEVAILTTHPKSKPELKK